MSAPYAALDARRLPRDHLPQRNLVSTLFELNGIGALGEAMAPLARLGRWLPELGDDAEPARTAYAEWLSTTMPTVFPADSAAAAVERATRPGAEEEPMAYTVLEDKLRRRIRESERRGIRLGEERGLRLGEERGIRLGEERGIAAERELLRRMAERKFGAAAAERLASLLAGTADAGGFLRAGGWLVDCATAEELLARIDGAGPNA